MNIHSVIYPHINYFIQVADFLKICFIHTQLLHIYFVIKKISKIKAYKYY